MFKSKYKKVFVSILIITVIAIVGVMGIIGYKTYNAYKIYKGAENASEKFEKAVESNNGYSKITTKYKDFTVIGTIRIPMIKFKYPILKENSTDALETSVSLLYTSQGLNNEGNSVIIGHNYNDGTMFSDLDELRKDDYIYILNEMGIEVRYKIYKIYNISNNEEDDYITRNIQGNREITLVTYLDDETKMIILAKQG